MKVKCIETAFSFIKYGEVYDVVAEHKNEYTIKTPYGNKTYNKFNFEIMKTLEEQIKEAKENYSKLQHETSAAWKTLQNLEKEYEETHPKVGQRYIEKATNIEHIVVKVTQNTYCLINLINGNRWCDPTENISAVFGRKQHLFRLI